MIYLALGVLCFTAFSVFMRIGADKFPNNLSMLATNYFVCMVIGAVQSDFHIITPEVEGFPIMVLLGVIYGLLLQSCLILMQRSTQKSGIVLPSISMRLGLLICILVSIVFFGEVPGAIQIVGFAIAIGAIILINYKKGEKITKGGAMLLLLLVSAGCTDAMIKFYEALGPESLSNQFLCIAFGAASLMCWIYAICKREKLKIKALALGVAIGVPNFFCSKLLLLAMTELPAVIVYPTFSVAGILVLTVFSMIFFKERLTKNQWFGLAATIVAMVLLNI